MFYGYMTKIKASMTIIPFKPTYFCLYLTYNCHFKIVTHTALFTDFVAFKTH